jgi:tetratricopeptide (TPR) repeat protein
MGSRAPLDHPELRAIEGLLDAGDVGEAQRRLGELRDAIELTDGIAYLTTRLLYLRGRLDARGVADRLSDLLARHSSFPEAAALLSLAQGKPIEPSRAMPEPAPPASSVRAPAEPALSKTEMSLTLDDDRATLDTSVSQNAEWPPRTGSHPPSSPKTSSQPPTVPASPEQLRQFTPIPGFDSPSNWPKVAAAPAPRSIIPDIPRAPAIPKFRENSAPPSYAPPERDSEFDPIHSKSLLPRDAGRYSEAPRSADVVEPARRRASRGPRNSGAPGVESARARPSPDTVPSTPHHIRSGLPARDDGRAPSLFEIASWIDDGRHRDAIAAINRAGPEAGTEYAVLRARALAGAGFADQAFDALERLEGVPGLEPELKAACARLFVELGAPDRALFLAKHALDASPDRPLVRLTYALAAIRAARRRPDDALLDQAERALAPGQGRDAPLPALHLALRACVQASLGDPERAVSIAQRALGLDPKLPDAFAALAEASARLGRASDARQAWMRLRDLSAGEATALGAMLAERGISVEPAGDRGGTAGDRPTDVEHAALDGRRSDAIRAVEQAAHDTVRRMAKSASQSGITAIATVAASFLTTAQVTSSFAPFDLSLWGLRRLEAALDVLYGADRRPRLQSDESGFVLLVGSYLGETLRLTHSGHWEGRIADLEAARVVAGARAWHPFRIVEARLNQGRRASILGAVGAAMPAPGTEPWQVRLPNPIAPPLPWSPRVWPKPSEIAAIGRSLPRSPIGVHCRHFGEGPLDGSVASLVAVDAYLDLVAPRGAPPDPDAAWTRRVAVLTGAYLGETLRELAGGEWVYGVDTADDALAFRLKLRGGIEATPIGHVLERVIGARSSTLADYAKTLLRRAGRG